jgi:epoxide hydrolase-like predicted phosphatase
MTIRAVFIDMGGVIVRTEFQAPRQHLADQLGLDYEDLIRLVFDSESAQQASIGLISEAEHWAAIMRRLRRPESQTQAIRDEFFAGDIIDVELVDYLRSLHGKLKVGLISNAWSGLRPYILSQKFEDAFDVMIISAEVKAMKPDARIYQIALEKLGVSPAEAVFLDDFPENVKAARAVGMQAIHFAQPEQAIQELKQLLANHEQSHPGNGHQS